MHPALTQLPEAPPLPHDGEQPAFAGWLRDRLPWRRVAAGLTYGVCLGALLRVPAVGNHAERVVLPVGRTPDDKAVRDRK